MTADGQPLVAIDKNGPWHQITSAQIREQFLRMLEQPLPKRLPMIAPAATDPDEPSTIHDIAKTEWRYAYVRAYLEQSLERRNKQYKQVARLSSRWERRASKAAERADADKTLGSMMRVKAIESRAKEYKEQLELLEWAEIICAND